MKQYKWLQDQSQINADNQKCVRPEDSRHFRNTVGNICKVKLMNFKRKQEQEN